MANYRIKGLPPIRLVDLLKKRKTNLKEFIKNSGIASYQTLLLKCNKMGVSAPNESDFNSALGKVVSSPQEGVVVLDPPTLTKDTGEKVEVDSFATVVPPQNQNPVEIEDSKQEPKTTNKNKKKVFQPNSASKSIKIDERVFVTSTAVNSLKNSGEKLGDVSVTPDSDLGSSISKLNNLKKK
jgi:hypothetical protein